MKKRKFLLFSFISLLILFLKVKWFNQLFANIIDSNQTKVLTHKILFKHLIAENHPEKPERIINIIHLLRKNKLDSIINEINLNILEDKWIKTIHSDEHIRSLRKKFPTGEKSSLIATKGCLQGVDIIMSGAKKNIFCAVRPPGHHALNTGKHEGFCFYNHIAITAKYIQKKYNLKRILIVDWDYHHGNSTELFFYDDPSILFFSTHDVNAYPRTGFPSRNGIGKGKGFNINVHLPCGTENKDIIKVFRNLLVDKTNKFEPEFVLISAGFDGRKDDPLGCFNVSDQGFKELTSIVMKIAEKHCNGRVLSILEGGYNIVGNAKAAVAHVQMLNNLL